MQVKDIFAADVARDIAPVVYFHEQDPHQVLAEVSEYIVTGGYPESDPRHKRIPSGIHEQLVRLLRNLGAELGNGKRVDLPSSWISGFYGSGKSSFAKLLGLSLDNLALPDGRPLSEALLARDDSPRAAELREAWDGVRGKVEPIAVVFDIGAVARDDEHIHSAVRRELQKRLGYCASSHYVADHELRLELDGRWDEFLGHAQATLGKPWSEAATGPFAEDDFSHVMHAMMPDRYLDPTSWIDSRAGAQTGIGSSVEETTRAIGDMLDVRARGRTLFLVVDEVSQYVHQNDSRMLKLQTFVSDLGQKQKGRVWLLATGQQKLEDGDDSSNIGKLKDRFPERLRVHLAPTNIRDVVHKRLLKKQPAREADLRALFQQHRSDLKLYAFGCDAITEDDFVEVYPMLPGHIDLLMRITTNLRSRSTRARGDDHAIRGLLQLLGELFRTQKLGEQALGALVTLDQIFEVQHTALDADVQNTLMRLFNHPEVVDDPMANRAAKAVALLELIQEQQATTSGLVAQCLYARLGDGSCEGAVQQALERLRALGLVSYSEKYGYKIQSSAGEEWQRERDAYGVTGAEISELVAEKLKALLGECDRPRLKSRAFPLAAWYSDAKYFTDDRLQPTADPAVVAVDFRYLTADEDRAPVRWVQDSDTPNLRDRLVWVVGKTATLPASMRDLARSRHQLQRYKGRGHTLPPERQRLLFDEETRSEELERQARTAVSAAFMEGEIYFRGRPIDKSRHGAGFASFLQGAGEENLPALYPYFVETSVSPKELEQLLDPVLSGPSQKFMKDGLGILELDAGKYVASCVGDIPSRISQKVIQEDGMSGQALLAIFGGPPYAYPQDVTRACLAGLLRAGKIRIRPEAGKEITSIRDPGVKDMFLRDRDLKKADVLPPGQVDISQRDRNAIRQFFEDHLSVSLDPENDAIAEATFQQFPNQVKRLQQLEARLNRLPGYREPPGVLAALRDALVDCTRSRHVEDTVRAVKKHLDALREGVQQLGIFSSELTDETVEAVVRAQRVRTVELAQLTEAGNGAEVASAAAALDQHFQGDRPWRDLGTLAQPLERIQECYQAIRMELIQIQDVRATEIRARLQARDGFEKLTPEEAAAVLRPVADAVIDTTAEAVQPTLVVLRDTPEARLAKAEGEANAKLDAILSGKGGKQVIPVEVRLSGREIDSVEDVEQVLKELRERLMAKLRDDTRLRLV